MAARQISFDLSPTQDAAFHKLRAFFEDVKNDLVRMKEIDGEPDPETRREVVRELYDREPPKGVIRPLQQFEQRMESLGHHEILQAEGLFDLWIDDPEDDWRYAFANRVYQDLEYDDHEVVGLVKRKF